MSGRQLVHSVDNWFDYTASSLVLVAQRQIVVVTPDKDQSIQEALLCKLVLELFPKTVPGSSYKTLVRGKVRPILNLHGILCYIQIMSRST